MVADPDNIVKINMRKKEVFMPLAGKLLFLHIIPD